MVPLAEEPALRASASACDVYHRVQHDGDLHAARLGSANPRAMAPAAGRAPGVEARIVDENDCEVARRRRSAN